VTEINRIKMKISGGLLWTE